MTDAARTGFFSIQSNVTELLAGIFASVQRDAAQVLSRELVVVARPGMDRWLSQFLAGRHGIAWDLQSIPLRKLWVEVARASGASWERLRQASPSRLRFRIAQCLGELDDQPVWAPILPHCDAAHRAFEFAQVQATLFEQYIDERPDTLKLWEKGGESQDWQAELWRRLWPSATEGPGLDSPVAECSRLIEGLAALDATGSMALRRALGPRIHVFACTQIPAATLTLLKALGEHLELRMYRVLPSPGFLGQTQDEHALLHGWSAGYTKASLSTESLALQDDQQLDHFLDPLAQVEEPAQASDLDRLCHSLIAANAQGIEFRGDASLQVHGCAGMMREVEVLHDRIACALLDYPHWSYEDVVVWVSDLSSYAPYIEAVFAPVDPACGPQIPYRIVDRHQSPHSPAFLTLFQLLDSFELRSTRENLLDLMGLDPIKQAFGWSDEVLLSIEEGIDQAQIRWGQNAALRAAQGQPEDGSNSWEQGLWRWALGCAYQSGPWADAKLPLVQGRVEPFCGARVEEDTLGQFARFLDLYFTSRAFAKEPASLEVWIERCQLLIEAFVPVSADPRGHQQLQDCLRTLKEDYLHSGAECLSFELASFRSMLSSVAQTADAAALWGRGGVTFGQLQDARPVPANMVVLLGMGEGQFPRNQSPPSWSLRVSAPQKHELSSRDEDRIAMMESLLCARERWLCIYSSRDLRGEHEWSASPLVQAFKAFVDAHASTEAGPIEVEHPISAFAPQSWTRQDARLACHQSMAWQVANAQARTIEPPAVIQRQLPVDPDIESIELRELLYYLEKPCASFLARRLGVVADTEKEAWVGTEPGVLERLERFKVADAVLEASLGEESVLHLGKRLAARGQLPWGQAGQAALAQIQYELAPLLTFVQEHLSQTQQLESWALDVTGHTGTGSFVLSGQVQGRVLEGQRWVLFPAKLNAKRRLYTWVQHLLLSVSAEPTFQGTQVLGIDKKEGLERLAWERMDSPLASAQLAVFVELWFLGKRWPLPIFLESALAYAKAQAKGKTHQQAIGSARSKYEASSGFGASESVKDWATKRIFGHCDALEQRVLADALGPDAPSRWSEYESDFAAISQDLWSCALLSEVKQ